MSNVVDNVNTIEKDKNDALYEDREPKKIIRIITVTAYMFSVSFVGIVLSAYYIFLWHPPNPRMMHAQAMSVHSEAQIDFLEGTPTAQNGLLRMSRISEGDRLINLFSQRPASEKDEKTKIRREIIKNVNALLKENFEKKTKSSEAPLQDSTLITDSTTSLDNETNQDSSILDINSTSTISSIAENMNNNTQKSLTNVTTTTTSTSTMASTTKRSKNSGKKQHQTPFALKHLEMPIKQDESRRRPTRLSTISTMTRTTMPATATTKRSSTTLDTRRG